MSINTSYNPLTQNGYYALPPSNGTNTQANAQAANQNAAGVLPDLSAYMLDLSPQAQNYLNSNISSADLSTAFAISQEQQKKIDEILSKYQDAPYTQETFDQIQSDLRAAGLSPDQLAGKARARDFNPTQALLDALGARKDAQPSQEDGAKYETQKKNYLQKIVGQFQKIAATSDLEL